MTSTRSARSSATSEKVDSHAAGPPGVLEDHCLSTGDAACHLVGRTREEWGDERAQELAFFEKARLDECLDVSCSV